MTKKTLAVIIIIFIIIVISFAAYAILPLFTNTVVNEPLPTAHGKTNEIREINDRAHQ